jgi:hypothetical protein
MKPELNIEFSPEEFGVQIQMAAGVCAFQVGKA